MDNRGTGMTRTWQQPTDAQLADILGATRSVAVVGISGDPSRPSNGVTRYLTSATGYDVALVNPRLANLFGRRVYPSLADLPEPPELVTVFRRQAALPGVAEEAIAAEARTLWLQLGLHDEDVARRAEQAGLAVVMDRCIKIEHARLLR
jgi:predicted CoA-binding protein